VPPLRDQVTAEAPGTARTKLDPVVAEFQDGPGVAAMCGTYSAVQLGCADSGHEKQVRKTACRRHELVRPDAPASSVRGQLCAVAPRVELFSLRPRCRLTMPCQRGERAIGHTCRPRLKKRGRLGRTVRDAGQAFFRHLFSWPESAQPSLNREYVPHIAAYAGRPGLRLRPVELRSRCTGASAVTDHKRPHELRDRRRVLYEKGPFSFRSKPRRSPPGDLIAAQLTRPAIS